MLIICFIIFFVVEVSYMYTMKCVRIYPVSPLQHLHILQHTLLTKFIPFFFSFLITHQLVLPIYAWV